MPLDDSILGGSVPFDPRETTANMLGRLTDEPAGLGVDLAADRLMRKVLAPKPQPVRPPVSKVSDPDGERAKPDLSSLGVPLEEATGGPDLSALGKPLEAPEAPKSPDQAAKPDPAQPEGGFLTDVAKIWSHGTKGAALDLRELVDRIPGYGKQIGGKLDQIDRYFGFETGEGLKKEQARIEKQMSAPMQASRRKDWWDENDKTTRFGWFGDAWTDPRSYVSGVVESLPEQMITMVPAMRLAKLAYAAKLRAGASAVEASKTAARTATIAGAVSEGMLGGAQSSREVRDTINTEIPAAALEKSEAFQSLVASGMSPQDARNAIANDAATRAFIVSGVATGLFGGMGDRMLAKILTEQVGKRGLKSLVGAGARSAVSEGVFEELPQSAAQKMAQNEALQQANPDQPLMQGVLNEALGGMAVGGLQGGGMGAAGHLARGPSSAPPAPQPAGPAAATPAQPPAAPPPPPAGAASPSPPPSQTSQPSPQQPAAATPAQPAQVEQNAPSREDEDYAILRSVGYTDDDIDGMGQSFRDSEIKYYRDDIGIDPAELVQRYPRPQAATTPPATPQPAADAGLPVPAGSRAEPIKAATAADVARAQPAEPVSQAQAEAENYRHAHVDLDALGLTGRSNVSVETGAGGVRKGVDRDGKPWQVQMPEGVAYGRIKGTQGADGQPLDIFIGPQPHSQHVFVIDQHHPEGGGFDEHKIMAGFVSPRAALDAYKASYDDGGGDRIGHVVAMSADEFKAWLQGDTTKPLKAGGRSAAPLEGDILPPAKVATITESAEEHHAQIEAVLGEDYDRVLPADTARAAEILSENPGMPPQLAFQHAVIANAVAQGYLTEQEAIDAYGQEVQDVLEPASQGTPERGGDAEPQGAASDEKPAGAATETGVVPDGGEAGARGREGEAAEGGERDQPDTGRGTTDQPDAGGEADAEAGEPETVKAKITDAGEKIGGARKDQWIGRGLNEDDLAGMTGAELDRFVTKHNVWNRPDYAQAIADGVDPVAAALIKRIYDGISAHPNNGKYGTFSDPEKLRRNYIGTLKAVRNAAAEAKTVDQVRLINDKVDKAIAAAGLDRWDAVSTLKIGTSRQNPLLVSDRDVHLAKRMVEAGFPNMEPWARLFTIARRAEWQNGKVVGEKFAVHRKNGGRIGDLHDTREAAEAAAKAAYEALSDERKKGGEEPKRPHLDQVERTGPDYRNGRDVTGDDFIKDFGFRGVEFGNWVAGDERQKVVNLAYDALHDLARALNLPAKAMSLDGTLAVAFGARGRGGRAAAHYEADRTVINMTKLSGAGSLAHEWGHALDHYLGESHARTPYKGSVQSISGWRTTPGNVLTHYASSRFEAVNGNLPLRLREAANRLMQSLFSKPEDDAEARRRVEKELEDKRKGQQGWMRHVEMIQQRMQKGGSRAGLKEAQTQVEVWGSGIVRLEKQLANGIQQKQVATDFHKQATILSGESGDYWRRPNEMFARSLEAYVFDKLAAEGFVSQYLVQGVEPERYGAGFKGNPYPAGDERVAINKLYDRLFRAITVGEGKLGSGTKIKAAEGLPEPVEDVVKVTKPAAQPTGRQEAEAVDQASQPKTLAALFADKLGQGDRFPTILQARRLAKESGFTEDAKAVEEAMELAVVMTARGNIETSKTPRTAYNSLVDLYQKQQPRLATRTSTSARDQAYSTPVPLGYLAQHLAGVTDQTTVYEPSAGNGALLTATNPEHVGANEINQERAKNLMAQGYTVTTMDATNRPVGAYDRILANPPFGAVSENGQSKLFDLSDIQPGYQTHEIDHAIALRALQAMKDDGRAVLIVGGISKTVTTQPARSDAYNGKAKRQFYKTLYDHYNVTDHFTVAGDLYERQGAGWPVDVIVINGRGKSSRALPAADVPRIYDSWTSLGGLLDAGQAGNARPAVGTAGGAAAAGTGLEGGGGRDRGDAGGSQPGLGDAGGVRGQRPAAAVDTGAAGVEGQGGAGAVREPARSGEQPAAERPSSGLSEGFDSIFKDALDAAYGPKDAERPTGPAPERKKQGAKSRDTRRTADVAKSAAENLTDSADKAFEALYHLFGGNKLSAGFTFDEDTYAKAKPLFEQAAQKFKDFLGDSRELVRRMVAHMRDALGWPRHVMEEMQPYFERFITDLQVQQAPAPRPAAPKIAATETENQVVYHPKSKVPGLDTLVPVNMRRSTAQALDALEDRVGPVDQFVGKELGYNSNELPTYFSAEQIDALGLAIDNIKRDRGFIIGDQTGIGKGRVNAAIIRWAIKNGRIPIFVTEKPGLYADMYRDLTDIGIKDMLDAGPRILATNADLKLPLEDGGDAAIATEKASKHNALLQKMAVGPDDFFKSYDMVFTNYSQMQTWGGEDTQRRAFLERIAPHSVLIFDESHNAGGQKGARKSKSAAVDRAGFARNMVQSARGVFYSSATYAKRPDVMDLYAATDMAMAVDDLGDLAEAIHRGGVPMQQVVASMLSEAGQYLRRERSFAGITYNTPLVPVDRDSYDRISGGLAAIQDLSKHTALAAAAVAKKLKAEGQALGHDGSTGEAGASSTSFTAVMHNVISQMLLAMKAEPAATAAIAAIKRGEKPVLTVANTMESFLSDYSDSLGIGNGDEMSADFSDVLKKYLDRTRTIIIKKPFAMKGEKTTYRHYLSDAELGLAGVAVYNRAAAIIAGMDLSGLPVSPIDHIKNRLTQAGYTVGEITGRTLVVDYSGEVPVLRSRPTKETSTKGRNATRAKFNRRPANGGIDAVIINQAGSTGISMHASVTFDDQSKRHMFVVQAEGNIDTHMQLLGRVNRTGQVVLPEYSQLVADIPAEKRPAANLAKKMASLNANTTASRSSALTAKDVPDFLNQYGDEVAVSYLSENFELNSRLAFPVEISENGKLTKEDAMRKLTGRIPLLPLAEQDRTYDELESEYTSLLQQLENAGENALEAKTFDLKAKTLTRSVVQGERNKSGSPFAAPVVMEKVSIVRPGKPYKPHDLMNRISQALGGTDELEVFSDPKRDAAELAGMLEQVNSPHSVWGKRAAQVESEERGRVTKAFNDYSKALIDDIDAEDKPEKIGKEITKHNELRNRWTAIHKLVTIGNRVTLKTASGNLLGIVIKVERSGKATNPMALSTWKATFAVPDATRTMVLPFSRIAEDGAADAESLLDVEVVPLPLWQERYADTIDRFQRKQTEAREERYIATGNLLAAYDWLEGKGQILNYTDTDGHIRQGILTSRDFDLRKHAIARGKMLSDPAEVKQYLDENPGTNKVIGNDIEIMRENRWSPNYLISAPKAKRRGGVYYLDRELTNATGDFYSQRGEMQVTITPAKLMPALARIIALGARLKVPAVAPNEQKVEDGGDALASIYTPQARQKLPEVDDLIRAAARHLVGDHVEVRLSDDVMPISGGDKWGDLASTALGARGLYSPRGHWIALARLPGMLKTLFHEAYHAIEYQLQTPAERALMRRETTAIRAYVGRKRPHYSRAQLTAIDDVEIRAIGAEEYLDEMTTNALRPGEGLHIGVRRFFDRLWRLSRRLASGLRGLGFKTWEDIYEKAYRGEYATAPGTTPRPEAGRRDDTLAALSHGPGGPNSFDNTLGDLVGARLARFLPNAFADLNMTEARVKVQDKFIRIKKAEQSVGQPVPSAMSAYQAESLYYGRTGWRLEQLEKNAIDPLVADMTARDIGIAEINEFLYARHAVERNIRIGMMHKPGSQFHNAVFDTSIVGASGMSTDEANTIIAAVDQSGKRADYDAIETRVRDLIDRTRDALLNDGLITQETYDAWKQQYAYYVPLRGFADGSEYEAAMMAGRGYDTRGKEAKTAFGRKSEADGPLNYVLLQAEMAIVRGEKNRVGNTMLRFVQNNPDPDRWEVNKPRFAHTIDRDTGLITTIPDNFADYRDPNVFITKVAGKPYRIRFHGADGANLARALNNMGTSNVNYVLRLFAVLTRTMARLATQWNPEFTIPNFARDVGEAFINLNEQQQRGFITAYAKHILPAVKGAAVATAGRGDPNDTYIRSFHEMDRVGGRIRFFGLDNPDDFDHTIARKMKRLEGGTVATMADLGEKLVKGIDVINGGVENGVRLAVYMAARDVGMSQADAAAVARDITVNFNRHGEMGGNIGALYMFYNAAAQGMARTMRAVQSKYVRRAFYAVAALGAMTAFYGIAAGGDDDDGEPHFLKIPAWDRDKNFIIMWPKGMGRDGKYVKIPVSFGLAGVFHAIGERMVAVAYGGEKPTKAAMAILNSVINVFDPTGGDENLVAKLFPTIGRPQVHIEMNKSWTGRPLYPDNSWDRSMPDSQKAFSTASGFSKEVAAKLNQWSGGSAYAPGAIDLHPASIDHWIQAITGGVGRFAAGLGSTAMGVYRGEEWDATKTPIVRRFYGSTDTPQADRAAYADARIEAKTREQQVDRAKKDLRAGVNVDESRAFVEKHQGPGGEHIFKGADQRVKMLRRQEEQAKTDTSLPEDERAARIKEIRGRMRDVQNEARKRYRKLKDEREKGRQGE